MSIEKNAYHYKQLKVWQKAMVLVVKVYKATDNFPKHEQYGLISQMRRCAISIPSNIAEGHGRNYDKELVRFLRVHSKINLHSWKSSRLPGNLMKTPAYGHTPSFHKVARQDESAFKNVKLFLSGP